MSQILNAVRHTATFVGGAAVAFLNQDLRDAAVKNVKTVV